jgi:hypothetical protein
MLPPHLTPPEQQDDKLCQNVRGHSRTSARKVKWVLAEGFCRRNSSTVVKLGVFFVCLPSSESRFSIPYIQLFADFLNLFNFSQSKVVTRWEQILRRIGVNIEG